MPIKENSPIATGDEPILRSRTAPTGSMTRKIRWTLRWTPLAPSAPLYGKIHHGLPLKMIGHMDAGILLPETQGGVDMMVGTGIGIGSDSVAMGGLATIVARITTTFTNALVVVAFDERTVTICYRGLDAEDLMQRTYSCIARREVSLPGKTNTIHQEA